MSPDIFRAGGASLVTSSSSLPVPATRAWQGEAPDPLADPSLYDGIRSRRVFGYFVDLAVILLIGAAVWVALGLVGIVSFGLLMPLVPLGVAVVPVGYHSIMVGSSGSATLGMRLFDLEVRSWTGVRPTLLQAFLMAVLFYASIGVTGFFILLVSLFNGRGRTLHDLLSGTVVVRRSALLARG
jgi:uncharacterized RDD family membrane protein YckC